MSWVLAAGLAVFAFAGIVLVLRAPRPGWEAIGAALLLGVAGYALQGSPRLPGAPKQPAQRISDDPEALVEARLALADKGAVAGDKWMVIADALARHGQYADAAGVLLGSVGRDPDNVEGWVALGNALVGHAEGTLTPAALFAYQRAAEAGPDHPGPPFFLGLALAQSGRLGEARALWAELLARAPATAEWRGDLEQRLQRLDQFIAAQQAAAPVAKP